MCFTIIFAIERGVVAQFQDTVAVRAFETGLYFVEREGGGEEVNIRG